MYSKHYERVIVQVKWQRVRWFQLENAPKAFGGRVLHGPADGAYSAPQDLLTKFKGQW